MQRRFFTLDVFTTKRFTGNPLAVVLEPDGLDTSTMQAVAREFGHPETVFVLPPADKAHRAKLRIFTPGRELPFAGHPTVGTAVLLGRLDGLSTAEFVLEEGVGPVRCRVMPGEGSGRASFVGPRLSAQEGTVGEPAKIAAAFGLATSDIGYGDYKTSRWSAGNPFSFVPVRGLAAMGRCRPDVERFDEAFGTSGHVGTFLFTGEVSEPGSHFHARMFAPQSGIAEDPATGSAVAAFAGLLAEQGGYGDGEHLIRIEQGYEMGRPSLMELTLTIREGKLAGAAIGGSAVIVTEGRIEA